MKYFIFALLLFTLNGDFNRIAEINRLRKEAETAYEQKHYREAATKYRILIDSLGVENDKLLMNLSHCYFNLHDTSNAFTHYKKLTQSEDRSYQSVAWQQLGILDSESRHYADAEEDFRNALRADPANEDARYNYELLKKKLKNQDQKNKNNQDQNKNQNKEDKQQNQDQQKQQQQDNQKDQQQQQKDQDQQKNQQNQDQQKQSQQGEQDKKDQEQKNQQDAQQQNEQDKNKKNEKGQVMNNDPFKENKISKEKARMILEAMRNTEEQYLQQLKRKSSKKPESGKPDW